MSFYERYQKAWDEQDISAMLDLYHPDYKRVFHAKGIEQGLDDLEPIMSRWLIGTKRNNRRCIYENDDIIVEHFIACLLYTSPSPRDGLLSRMPSSA